MGNILPRPGFSAFSLLLGPYSSTQPVHLLLSFPVAEELLSRTPFPNPKSCVSEPS